MDGFVAARITRSRRGKLYIGNTTWGSEADSVESGYRVPIGSIHLFIGRLDGSEPQSDCDIPTKTASRLKTVSQHAFVGFTNGSPEPAHSIETLEQDESAKYSEADLCPSKGKYSDFESLHSVGNNILGFGSEQYDPNLPYFQPSYYATVYMAGPPGH